MAGPTHRSEGLLMWRKARQFVLAVYALTASFPKHETYGLVSRMRRAAVSIPANIAEGFKKRGRADMARFLSTDEGSIQESRYYLILARDLGYGETQSLGADLEEISRLVHTYGRAILSSVS